MDSVEAKSPKQNIDTKKESGGAVPQKSAKPPVDTREDLAKIAGVSHDTIHKVEVIQKKGSEAEIASLRRGDPNVSINRVYDHLEKKAGKGKRTRNAPSDSERDEEPFPEEAASEAAALRASDAMQLAEIAITNLQRIRDDDPRRDDAFDYVIQWIQNQKEG